ncbi:hypothetical protein D3C73_644380 [compost metagenome]
MAGGHDLHLGFAIGPKAAECHISHGSVVRLVNSCPNFRAGDYPMFFGDADCAVVQGLDRVLALVPRARRERPCKSAF